MSASRTPPTAGDDATVAERGEPLALQPGPLRGTDRYLAVERLGEGGMGEVVLAFDPKLQREVALKSVRTSALGDVARARLLREAQAMAQLTHPNVVAVFDVETRDGEVVIVMEYVPGPTLRKWLEKPRDWRSIVSAFVAAGRGLVAAHAAGIVHRDFKPSNVLHGVSGSAAGLFKVTDFGLARRRDVAEAEAAGVSHPEMGVLLTTGGMVVGTPAYMAPEQHAGEDATAAADQFAWCVSLWEALVGARPYTGRDLATLAAAKHRGPPSWPRVRGVPRAVGRAIRRGLAVDPADRWPDLASLLDALERSMRPRALRVAALATGLAAIGIAIAVATADPAASCDGGAARLGEVWSVARAGEVEASMSALGLPFAEASWSRAVAVIDDYATRWIEHYDDTCRATHVRGDQSAAVLDLRMACLEQARTELRATLEVFAAPDRTVAENAIRTATGLPPLERCTRDAVALASDVGVPDDPVLATEVERLRVRLGDAVVAMRAGRIAVAHDQLLEIAADVSATGFGPLVAEHGTRVGWAALNLGRYDEADLAFNRALRTAIGGGDPRRAAAAANGCAALQGIKLQHFASGRLAGDVALGFARAADDVNAEIDARFTLAGIASHDGHLDESEAEVRVAIEMAERAPEYDESRSVWFHSLLARLIFLRGAYAEAEAETRVFEDELTRIFGENHPALATAWNSLGGALLQQGRFDESEAYLRRAIALQEAALGADSLDAVHGRANLGAALHAMGRYDEAEAEYRAAIAGVSRALGPDDIRVGTARFSYGEVLNAMHRDAEAEVEYRAGLDILTRALPAGHENVSTAQYNLGAFLRTRGRATEGLPWLESSWAARQADRVTPSEDLADGAYELARALHETGAAASRSRIDALLARANAECPAESPRFAERCREIAAWRP